MQDLKSILIDKFTNEINSLDLSLNESALRLKYNTITENIFNTILIQRDKNNLELYKYEECSDLNINLDNICAGKSSDTFLSNSDYMPSHQIKQELNPQTKIPSNFALTYEMKEFAKSKYINEDDVEDLFEDFVIHYKQNEHENKNWDLMWQKWVKKNNQFKNHLPTTPLSSDFQLDQSMITIAKGLLSKDQIQMEFENFKTHHIAKGTLKSNWKVAWQNWCINHKQFKPKVPKKQTVNQQEKADYKWDFKKAKDISDKIKDWLEFDVKINWMEQYYWKDIHQFEIKTNDGVLKLGWRKMPHPDFNKDEILLFKLDTNEAQYLLNDENIDTVEVIEND